MNIIRKFGLALGGMALVGAAVPATAQMIPENYQLLVDCGSVNALASTGTDSTEEKAAYEKVARAFWQVAMAYASKDSEGLKADGSASIAKVASWVDSQDPKVEALVTKCVALEEDIVKMAAGEYVAD